MKKIIYIYYFLYLATGFSQIQQAKVEYKKVRLKKIFNKNKKNKTENFETFSKIENSINEIQKEIFFDLIFKNGKSLFKVRKKMSISNNKLFEMSLGPEGNSKYYNSETEILREVNTFGEDFLISKPKYKWILKSETKKIGRYICKKAIFFEKVKTRKGIINILIEAWYTPNINIPFGPIGYSGLPGLIIELKRDNIKYFVSNININPKDKLIIKKLNKGKKVTQEEFYEIAIKTMKSFRRNK